MKLKHSLPLIGAVQCVVAVVLVAGTFMTTSGHEFEGLAELKIIQVLGLIISIACVGSIFLILNTIFKKVAMVRSLASEYAKGNLSNRAEASAAGSELDEVLFAMNSLGDSIAAIVSEIKTADDTLLAVTQEFSGEFSDMVERAGTMQSKSTTVAAAAEEASSGTSSISAAAEHMSDSVISVSVSMDQMSATINEIARNCNAESAIAQKAQANAASTRAVIERLNDSTREIERVISLIGDVAKKTNLLALNASIEAASAGDAGKGFAVVANEVKDLAGQTARATSEIRSQIDRIRTDMGAAISSVAAIAEVIEEVNNYSQTIVVAVEEQSATAAEISRNLTQASNAATAIARNVSETALGIQEVTGNIQQVSSETAGVAAGIRSSQEKVTRLSSLAGNLHSVLGTFKIRRAEILWRREYETAVPSIDKQHKKLVALINVLSSSIAEGRTQNAMRPALEELVSYTVDHFSFEEGLMEKAGFPDLRNHIAKHKEFVATVSKFKTEFDSGRAMLSAGIISFLTEWLVKHILGEDKRYAGLMVKKGIQ